MASKEQAYYKTLIQVTKAVNRSLDPAKALAAVAEAAAKAMEVKACVIRILDKEKTHLLPGASFGLSMGYLRKGQVEVKKSGIDQDVLAGKTVFLKNITEGSSFQYPERAKQEGLCSVLVVPLTLPGGRIIGVMRVYTAEERNFAEDEVDFLTTIAEISAMSIENAMLHQALKRDLDLHTAFIYRTFED
jgi:signal transduction protein with GAF and PtsI domain